MATALANVQIARSKSISSAPKRCRIRALAVKQGILAAACSSGDVLVASDDDLRPLAHVTAGCRLTSVLLT